MKKNLIEAEEIINSIKVKTLTKNESLIDEIIIEELNKNHFIVKAKINENAKYLHRAITSSYLPVGYIIKNHNDEYYKTGISMKIYFEKGKNKNLVSNEKQSKEFNLIRQNLVEIVKKAIAETDNVVKNKQEHGRNPISKITVLAKSLEFTQSYNNRIFTGSY